MKITLRQLQVFTLTSKLGSVSEAAKACFITQSAASMSLSDFETMLGFPVFDRIGKRLHLNANGQNLLPKAVNIIDRAEELTSLAGNKSLDISGTIKIIASATIGNYVLPNYLANFKKQFPNADFQLTVTNTERAIHNINQLSYDIGLVEGNCQEKDILKSTWQEDSLIILARKDHPLTNKKSINEKDLAKFPWVTREDGSGTRRIFMDELANRLDLDVPLSFSSPEAIKEYVRHSDYLTCISSATLNTKNDKSLQIINVKNLNLTRPFYLLTHKQKFKTNLTAAFETFIKQHQIV